jgi:5S rRNA maturation endonuclease (ribonuclease M5)
MIVKELIEQLKKCDQDKVVILTEPDGKGWDNVGVVIETLSNVKITMDGNGLFQES